MKHIKIIFCFLTILILCPMTCQAHQQAREHDRELEAVLFEDGYSKHQSNAIKKNIECLEAASYLAIDQFGGKGEDKSFNVLKSADMGGLPFSFASIDYYEDLQGNGKQINANTHRKYTHQGWDREYETKSAKKFWKARRKVLLGTVDSIFDFKGNGLTGYSEECNALSGIIYYVHILGDYNEADNYKKVSLLTDLAGHEKTDKNDMITALKGYTEILFADQKQSNDCYKELMDGLDNIAEDTGKLVNSVGGVNTDDEFEEYHQYADDIMELLVENVPKLLKKEGFFNEVFYCAS